MDAIILNNSDIVVFNNQIGRVITNTQVPNETRFLPCDYGCYYINHLDIITPENTRPATQDEKLTLISKEYTWGDIINIHCISDFQIIEAIRKDDNETHFHAYHNYLDTCTSYRTLDEALIGVICKKYEGPNQRLSDYITRILMPNL